MHENNHPQLMTGESKTAMPNQTSKLHPLFLAADDERIRNGVIVLLRSIVGNQEIKVVQNQDNLLAGLKHRYSAMVIVTVGRAFNIELITTIKSNHKEVGLVAIVMDYHQASLASKAGADAILLAGFSAEELACVLNLVRFSKNGDRNENIK